MLAAAALRSHQLGTSGTAQQPQQGPQTHAEPRPAVPRTPQAPHRIAVVIEKPSWNSRRLFASLEIDAPADRVWFALTDYENLGTFIPSLVENQCLSRSGDTAVLRQVGAVEVTLGIRFRAACTLECTEYATGVPEWLVAADSDALDDKLPRPRNVLPSPAGAPPSGASAPAARAAPPRAPAGGTGAPPVAGAGSHAQPRGLAPPGARNGDGTRLTREAWDIDDVHFAEHAPAVHAAGAVPSPVQDPGTSGAATPTAPHPAAAFGAAAPAAPAAAAAAAAAAAVGGSLPGREVTVADAIQAAVVAGAGSTSAAADSSTQHTDPAAASSDAPVSPTGPAASGELAGPDAVSGGSSIASGRPAAAAGVAAGERADAVTGGDVTASQASSCRDITFWMLKGDFQVFKGVWRVECCEGSAEAGRTLLSYSLVVQPQPWLPAFLVQARIEREMVRNLEAVRDHTEQQALASQTRTQLTL
ncbi:MAG: hypothetical protein WDW36_009711 [Sanguina aurantia]